CSVITIWLRSKCQLVLARDNAQEFWWPMAELNHRHTDFQNWPQQAFYSKSSSYDTRQVPRAATHSLRVLGKSHMKLRNGYAGYDAERFASRRPNYDHALGLLTDRRF